MKKKLIALTVLAAFLMLSLAACAKEKESSTEGNVKVTLNEVAHSIFYAPMYVAIEEGYFSEEGIDLELVTGFGANYLV